MRRSVVPPYLLSHLASSADPRFSVAAESARQSLVSDPPVRQQRVHVPQSATEASPAPGIRSSAAPRRAIYDAQGSTTMPGRLARDEGDPPTGDAATDEAYDGLGHTHRLLLDAYGRASIDARNMQLDAVVHYGQRYDNAFWDGSRMVFGDGDGEVFRGFTSSLSVIGHELAHGLTQFTAGLVYEGQSGALAESVSDVFGAMVEQYALGQTAQQATWLIGEGVFTELVQGRALRSMLMPGTAYNDDVLGKDPQPGNMRDYIVTSEDSGGVHLNSGIPNRAFALAAVAVGGAAWEGAGRVWYDTLTSGRLARDANFSGFAALTLDVAAQHFGRASREHRAVGDAWAVVGVQP